MVNDGIILENIMDLNNTIRLPSGLQTHVCFVNIAKNLLKGFMFIFVVHICSEHGVSNVIG